MQSSSPPARLYPLKSEDACQPQPAGRLRKVQSFSSEQLIDALTHIPACHDLQPALLECHALLLFCIHQVSCTSIRSDDTGMAIAYDATLILIINKCRAEDPMSVSNFDFNECGNIITPCYGHLRVRNDPKNKILKNGIYIVCPQMRGKWILSIYRDRCLGTNEIEITVDPVALEKMSSGEIISARVFAWLADQRGQLQNESPRNRITNKKINAFTIGFKLPNAKEFLIRLNSMLNGPSPTWTIDLNHSSALVTRMKAVRHMMKMAYQAQTASGTERLEVAKEKEVRFRSETEFHDHIDTLLQDGTCAITKLPLDLSFTDLELAPSLDRVNSNGHYEVGNLQVVARFVNRWKSDDDQTNFKRLIALVRQSTEANRL